MKVIVGSTNPVKIAATLEGFLRMFPGEKINIEGVAVASGVRAQPMTTTETRCGAFFRAHDLCTSGNLGNYDADYYVGLEGGIAETDWSIREEEYEAFAWIVVIAKDGRIGRARTGSYSLPPTVVHLIKQGKELGEADDIVYGRTNSKQGNGSTGILTGDVITRQAFYAHAVVLALIPFKNPELYGVK
jgi:inosine/xanthosine triphosphatase